MSLSDQSVRFSDKRSLNHNEYGGGNSSINKIYDFDLWNIFCDLACWFLDQVYLFLTRGCLVFIIKGDREWMCVYGQANGNSQLSLLWLHLVFQTEFLSAPRSYLLARPASQQAHGIPLSLLAQFWDTGACCYAWLAVRALMLVQQAIIK